MRVGEWRKWIADPEFNDRNFITKSREKNRTFDLHFYRWPLNWSLAQCMNNLNATYEFMGPWENIPCMHKKETISYENTKRRRYGDCVHDKDYFRIIENKNPDPWIPLITGTDKTVYHHSEGSKVGFNGGTDEAWIGYPTQISQHLASVPDTEFDVESNLASAINEMKPEIETQLSTLVTLAELREMKRLVTGPLTIAKNVRSLFDQGKSFLALLKGAGSIDLTHTYGNRQLVNDLLSLYSAIKSTSQRLDTFVKNSKSPQVRHWSIEPVVTEDAEESVIYPDSNWTVTKYVHTKQVEKFNVTMKFKYDIVDSLGTPVIDSDLLTLGAYLDAFGLNWNPAILWDATPFTFIVDWFIGVGDWLESFKRSNLNASVTILDACYSIKRLKATDTYNRNTYRDQYPGSATTDGPMSAQSRTIRSTSHYERHRFVPRSTWLHGEDIDVHLPSLRQWRLGASLVVANLVK